MSQNDSDPVKSIRLKIKATLRLLGWFGVLLSILIIELAVLEHKPVQGAAYTGTQNYSHSKKEYQTAFLHYISWLEQNVYMCEQEVKRFGSLDAERSLSIQEWIRLHEIFKEIENLQTRIEYHEGLFEQAAFDPLGETYSTVYISLSKKELDMFKQELEHILQSLKKRGLPIQEWIYLQELREGIDDYQTSNKLVASETNSPDLIQKLENLNKQAEVVKDDIQQILHQEYQNLWITIFLFSPLIMFLFLLSFLILVVLQRQELPKIIGNLVKLYPPCISATERKYFLIDLHTSWQESCNLSFFDRLRICYEEILALCITITQEWWDYLLCKIKIMIAK